MRGKNQCFDFWIDFYKFQRFEETKLEDIKSLVTDN